MAKRAPPSQPSIGILWQCLAAVGIVTLAGLLEFGRPINHDVAWALTVADLLHRGRRLYSGIIEINPPLMFWAAGVARQLAEALRVTPETVFRCGVLLLGVGSAFSLRRATKSIWPASALAVGGLILVGPDFGQRDVLTALLLSPFVAMASTGARPRHAWLVGILAAIGICLKPFYLTVWVIWAFRHRGLSADLVIIGTGALYLVSVLLLEPAYLPFVKAFGPSYESWLRIPWTSQILSATALLTFALLGLAIIVHRRIASWALGFACAAAGAMLAAVGQAKPFTYHQFPALIFGLVASTELVTVSTRMARVAARILAFGLLGQCAVLWLTAHGGQVQETAVVQAIRRRGVPRRSVFLSEFLFHGPPTFRRLGLPWLLSAPSLWWMSAPEGTLSDSARGALTRRVASDIQTADVVIIDRLERNQSDSLPFENELLGEPAIGAALRAFPVIDTTGLLMICRRSAPRTDVRFRPGASPVIQ